MKPLLYGTLLVIVAAATTTAVAGVKTDYDHSITFDHYHTFAWRQAPAAPNDLGDNTLLRSRITSAMNQQLLGKGMHEDSANPDVYLTYRYVAHSRNDINSFPSWGSWGWRRGGWAGSNVYVNRYTEGTFVIDMVDAKTNQLVWRAYGSDTGSNPIDVQSDKNVGKIVSQALKHFPPKGSNAG